VGQVLSSGKKATESKTSLEKKHKNIKVAGKMTATIAKVAGKTYLCAQNPVLYAVLARFGARGSDFGGNRHRQTYANGKRVSNPAAVI
jgi:hypothetical protein